MIIYSYFDDLILILFIYTNFDNLILIMLIYSNFDDLINCMRFGSMLKFILHHRSQTELHHQIHVFHFTPPLPKSITILLMMSMLHHLKCGGIEAPVDLQAPP